MCIFLLESKKSSFRMRFYGVQARSLYGIFLAISGSLVCHISRFRMHTNLRFSCIFCWLHVYLLFKLQKFAKSVCTNMACKRALRAKNQVLGDARGEVEIAVARDDEALPLGPIQTPICSPGRGLDAHQQEEAEDGTQHEPAAHVLVGGEVRLGEPFRDLRGLDPRGPAPAVEGPLPCWADLERVWRPRCVLILGRGPRCGVGGAPSR